MMMPIDLAILDETTFMWGYPDMNEDPAFSSVAKTMSTSSFFDFFCQNANSQK